MKASECKCCECDKQAVVFWTMIDPDIPALPYCRKCLNKAKAKVLIEAFGHDEKIAKAIVKYHNNSN